MTAHGQPMVWRGKKLRTIVACVYDNLNGNPRRLCRLDCGHTKDLTGHTHRNVGQRTICELCR